MTWILTIGSIFTAWAFLSLLGGERSREVQILKIQRKHRPPAPVTAPQAAKPAPPKPPVASPAVAPKPPAKPAAPANAAKSGAK
jgi:hypothetical protein